ncbi:hypothetical protein DFH08DRAFT_153038 [Mycena albidolilacea]|uniref:Uncharacterized protein n=1 Tax=Mycena albidolilacea TaxID=1033008 RepID=A0AAD7ERR9_9AGAR|nr:hypothetical protein DFH08DRAFT_153038 [Mycena albidolilacea]
MSPRATRLESKSSAPSTPHPSMIPPNASLAASPAMMSSPSLRIRPASAAAHKPIEAPGTHKRPDMDRRTDGRHPHTSNPRIRPRTSQSNLPPVNPNFHHLPPPPPSGSGADPNCPRSSHSHSDRPPQAYASATPSSPRRARSGPVLLVRRRVAWWRGCTRAAVRAVHSHRIDLALRRRIQRQMPRRWDADRELSAPPRPRPDRTAKLLRRRRSGCTPRCTASRLPQFPASAPVPAPPSRTPLPSHRPGVAAKLASPSAASRSRPGAA